MFLHNTLPHFVLFYSTEVVIVLEMDFNSFREIGTIVRSLKCCPTEGELHDILADVIE